MASHVHDASGPWAIGLTVAVLVLTVAYLRGWVWLRFSSNPLPAWRALCFLAGVGSVWAAAAPPIGGGDQKLLTFHMVQHLLLMTFAPPLIYLGEPVMVLGPGVRRFAKALHPAVCWLAATATLVIWHVPGAFTLAFQSPTWHAVEQSSFLASGLLFWWPVVQPWPSPADPRWSTVLYLFLATLPCDILSGFLVFSDRVAYSVYLTTRPAAAVLDDQQCAGALMWTCVTIVYLVAGVVVSTQLLSRPGPSARPRLAEVL